MDVVVTDFVINSLLWHLYKMDKLSVKIDENTKQVVANIQCFISYAAIHVVVSGITFTSVTNFNITHLRFH